MENTLNNKTSNMKAYWSNYKKVNKEKLKDYQLDYYKKNKHNKVPYLRNYMRDNLNGRYISYKSSAKKRGFIFDISKDDFNKIISLNCVYCNGSEFIGIDRKDNSIGYTISNVQSCCTMCNMMKRTYTEEDFISQCKKIVDNIK
jgi:hypothetical protein